MCPSAYERRTPASTPSLDSDFPRDKARFVLRGERVSAPDNETQESHFADLFAGPTYLCDAELDQVDGPPGGNTSDAVDAGHPLPGAFQLALAGDCGAPYRRAEGPPVRCARRPRGDASDTDAHTITDSSHWSDQGMCAYKHLRANRGMPPKGVCKSFWDRGECSRKSVR